MYWIFVDTQFEASHQLTFADGTREPLHAHVWGVTAGVCSADLDRAGLVMDFVELERMVRSVVGPLEGKMLEGVSFFAGGNASAERVARYLYEAICPCIAAPARLGYVEVTEAAGCRARYDGGNPAEAG